MPGTTTKHTKKADRMAEHIASDAKKEGRYKGRKERVAWASVHGNMSVAPGPQEGPQRQALAEVFVMTRTTALDPRSLAETAAQRPALSGCRHHWLIETPGGQPTSRGQCRRCGGRRRFANAIADIAVRIGKTRRGFGAFKYTGGAS